MTVWIARWQNGQPGWPISTTKAELLQTMMIFGTEGSAPPELKTLKWQVDLRGLILASFENGKSLYDNMSLLRLQQNWKLLQRVRPHQSIKYKMWISRKIEKKMKQKNKKKENIMSGPCTWSREACDLSAAIELLVLGGWVEPPLFIWALVPKKVALPNGFHRLWRIWKHSLETEKVHGFHWKRPHQGIFVWDLTRLHTKCRAIFSSSSPWLHISETQIRNVSFNWPGTDETWWQFQTNWFDMSLLFNADNAAQLLDKFWMGRTLYFCRKIILLPLKWNIFSPKIWS